MVRITMTTADVISLKELRLAANARRLRGETRTPTRLATLVKLEEVSSHRSLSCTGYDACLSEALLRRWPSWTCRSCSQFALRDDLRALEVAHEAARHIDFESDSYAFP
jgi:hypothetical protein